MKSRSTLVAALPPALAIAVFGVIYGSLADPLMGPAATLASSLFIFSGSVQFTIAGLLLADAGFGALLAGATTLNLRNLLLGAVLRPRIHAPPLRRAGLAWFLTDEATGLALTRPESAERILLGTGGLFYLSWQAGTVMGVLGASLEGLAATAEAVFPVLFIGLAALACSTGGIAARAACAAAITVAAATLVPGAGAAVAVGASIAVALPGRSS